MMNWWYKWPQPDGSEWTAEYISGKPMLPVCRKPRRRWSGYKASKAEMKDRLHRALNGQYPGGYTAYQKWLASIEISDAELEVRFDEIKMAVHRERPRRLTIGSIKIPIRSLTEEERRVISRDGPVYLPFRTGFKIDLASQE